MGFGFHEQVVRAAVDSAYLSENRPLAAFVDTAAISRAIQSLKNAFPDHFEHMFAAKANTMRRALELVKEQGMGCEVASPG